jgi:hypothetical protein
MMGVAPSVLSNLVVIAVAAAAAFVLWTARRQPWWREAAHVVYRRQPLAVIALGAYVLVGGLDSIAWVGATAAPQADLVARYEPRSVIDRLFPPDFRERSYSAPFADAEFYGGPPLLFPARHQHLTHLLGRDVRCGR